MRLQRGSSPRQTVHSRTRRDGDYLLTRQRRGAKLVLSTTCKRQQMHSVLQSSLAPDIHNERPAFGDDELSIGIAADALLACHARGADGHTMLAMCERLLTVTERTMLERETRMMATGDENLAAQVRRHGDVLFVLGQQVKASRRTAAPLPRTFVQFVNLLAERFRAPRIEAA
jgi:hypothetical protein